VKIFRQLLQKTRQPRGTKFDRYYVGLLQPGAGYPTADEARRDLAEYNRTMFLNGWPR